MLTILSYFKSVIQSVPDLHRLEPHATSYDELFKDPSDGCARCDDVWGG